MPLNGARMSCAAACANLPQRVVFFLQQDLGCDNVEKFLEDFTGSFQLLGFPREGFDPGVLRPIDQTRVRGPTMTPDFGSLTVLLFGWPAHSTPACDWPAKPYQLANPMHDDGLYQGTACGFEVFFRSWEIPDGALWSETDRYRSSRFGPISQSCG